MLEILTVDTPGLGDRSYLFHDGATAAVVDAQRDIDRMLEFAARHGVRIRHVLETHIHNDYVTGGRALASAVGASYYVSAADPVAFERVAVNDGDLLELSDTMSLRVRSTPGHTFTHLAYFLVVAGEPVAAFTGGSLLYGSVGRTDLLGSEHAEPLTRAQYRSAQLLADELPAPTELYPTHGFGSFCAATEASTDRSSIGAERASNVALTRDEDSFVAELLAGLDAYPAYYAHMSPANLAAPSEPPDLSLPRLADAGGVSERLEAGDWVVDLRNRRAFAAGHLPGSLNFGLDGQFATYLGWLRPVGRGLTLLGESPQQVSEAVRELVRIGIDRPNAAAAGPPASWSAGPLATTPLATFADLAARQARPGGDAVTVVDLRLAGDYRQAHVAGARNLPVHELPSRAGELPGGEIWVHCSGGYRASIAGSVLSARGRDAVVVDDEFANAGPAGLLSSRSPQECQ